MLTCYECRAMVNKESTHFLIGDIKVVTCSHMCTRRFVSLRPSIDVERDVVRMESGEPVELKQMDFMLICLRDG